MYKVRKNNVEIVVFSVLIFAEDRDVLWWYRNMVREVENMVSCKLDLTLTARYLTVLDLLKFETEEWDIYLIDSQQTDNLKKKLERLIRSKYPNCHGIRKAKEDYVYNYIYNDEKGVIKYRKLLKADLEKQFLEIVELLQNAAIEAEKRTERK